MIIDDREIARLRSQGIGVLAGDGTPLSAPKPRGKTELDYLKEMAATLAQLLDKPAPSVAPPVVRVTTPEMPAPPEPIRRWKFELTRNSEGRTTVIIATALE